MTHSLRPRPVVLVILDGWGHRTECEDNAICQARTPVLDRFAQTCRPGLIDASEHEVGLPDGQMGNSEVGHMNLGAGRIVLQDLPRIDEALRSGALAKDPTLSEFIARMKDSGGCVHLMGLLSPGGVHSHQDHMAALAEIVQAAGIPVRVHGFLDGRDTPPRSALSFVETFQAKTTAPIASITGRYYAMDRDQRWARVKLAFNCLAEGGGEHAETAAEAVEAAYARGESDEFVLPTVIGDYAGMADGDGILMANFRADRVRQLLNAFLDPDFAGFERDRTVDFAAALGMVSYSSDLDRRLGILFPPLSLENTLGQVVADAGLSQLRIAETEKYAHVTFFFNGGREREFPGESRVLVPSPQVATYDLQPEMSAPHVTRELVKAVESGRFDVIIANYANGDMVGHTGDLAAATEAAEVIDTCLGALAEAVEEAGGCLVITADHGNAEQMVDRTSGQAHTAHTMNPVPIYLVNGPSDVAAVKNGRLADIAPTVLDLMGLDQPETMTGQSLLRRAAANVSEAVQQSV